MSRASAAIESRWPNLVIGVLILITVIAADYGGSLSGLENWFYDRRARFCHLFATTQIAPLVHVHVDDASLERIHRWPWPRDILAQLIDEMRLAGARYIALDILLDTPDVDNDPRLAKSIRDAGNVILVSSVHFADNRPATPAQTELTALLNTNLELQPDAASDALTKKGFEERFVREFIAQYFVDFRSQIFAQRISETRAKLAADLAPLDEDARLQRLQQELLPKLNPDYTDSPLKRLLLQQYAKSLATEQMQRFCVTPLRDVPPMLKSIDCAAPIHSLAASSAGVGFVDYLPDPDGAVRWVPLFVNYRDTSSGKDVLLPQFGLVAACAMLGADVRRIEISANSIVIPCPDGRRIKVPVRSVNSEKRGELGLFLDLPWINGDRDWETLYDIPDHTRPVRQESVNSVWETCRIASRLEGNRRSAENLLIALGKYFSGRELADADAQSNAVDLHQRIGKALALVDREIRESQDSALAASLQKPRNKLALLNDELRRDENELPRRRLELREKLNAKVVFFGWIATGNMDFVPTSLHARCPGVIVHGAILNGILTNSLWRSAPPLVTLCVTVLMGLIAVFSVTYLSPISGSSIVLGSLGAYLLLNGLVLFDYNHYIVGVAGPVVASGTVWASLLLKNIVEEIAERRRITGTFRQYVDPTLVDYVIKNRDQAGLEGKISNLTVVFTDLAGYTRLSEQLGTRIVPLLSRYMEAMVPVIRKHRGYVNKFLGDGIMCFFGAPIENKDHAIDAVSAVLQMQQELKKFNAELTKEEFPEVSMRAGINTGDMIVGNAGPRDASDYTVLGDAVNLGSRLESANKAFGTRILISQETADSLDGKFLMRPIGRIRVVGRHEPVTAYEVLCPGEAATPEYRRLVDATKRVFDLYQHARFDECLSALMELEQLVDNCENKDEKHKLVELYRRNCIAARARTEPEPFDGVIELIEK